MPTNHEKKIERIETEIVKLRNQILQLEFQYKKDIIQSEKEREKRWKKNDEEWERTKKHLRHLSQFAGIAFDEIGQMNGRLNSASAALAPRKNKK